MKKGGQFYVLQSNLSQRPPPNSDHLPTATTILESQFMSLYHKPTSEQRPPVKNGLKFWVPKVIVVRMFDCI